MLLALHALAAHAQTTASWEVVGTAGFSAGPAGFTSLAFGPEGRPYVAYVDTAHGDRASVMRLNSAGTAWETVGRAGFSEGGANETSLAFGPEGKPYVAYRDLAHDGRASVMRLNSAGTAWETVGRAGFSAGSVSDTSLAFSPDGRPYVAFMDFGIRAKGRVMRLNATGTAWEAVGGSVLSERAAVFTSLAFSPEGRPYVAFADTGHGSRARVVRLNNTGTAWESVGGGGFSADTAICTSLAFGPDGKPYVAFASKGDDHKASVMRLNRTGTAWETVGGAGFSSGSAAFTSLAFGPDAKPYVAYVDVASGYTAKVMGLNTAGTAWAAVGDGLSGNGVVYTSLAFGPDGSPYVAFWDHDHGGKATVMRGSVLGLSH